MRQWTGTLALLLLLGGGMLPIIAKGERPAEAPAVSKEQWREDLRYLARELPKRHKNLFHAVTKEQFERSVADLDAAIPSLLDHQIVVRMMQIAASVGDGHTGVHLPAHFGLYPLGLFWFGPELRVMGGAKEYESAIGKRVVGIGSFDIAEVQKRIVSCFPSAGNENEWYVLSTSPAFIVRPEVLHALGIVPELEHASFTFEDDDGRQLTIEIRPTAPPPVTNKAFAPTGWISAAKEQPLFRQKPAETFWVAYLENMQTAYVNFRGYDSLGRHAKELFELIDSKPVKRVVIDMRQNGGGDFFEGRKHLIEPLKKRAAINQKGRLFVIIGRRTFSAAMANAIDFRKETNAILVGEPIGERPNSYSENDEMTLPNSRLVVSYSTRYYKFLEEEAPAVMPDERIDPNWPDFRAGRDPVMAWILSQKS